MTRLDSLSDECILEINSYLPAKSLLPLAATCRILNRCTTPHIYRFVYFWESGCRGYIFPKALAPEWPWLEPRPTRIVDLSSFLRTLQHSPSLRSYIRIISFDWNQIPSEGNHGQNKTTNLDKAVLDVLDLLPASIFTHISRDPAIMGLPGCASDWDVPEGTNTYIEPTAVDVDLLMWVPEKTEPYSTGVPTRNTYYNLFHAPNLRHLSLRGCRSWRSAWREEELEDSLSENYQPGLSDLTTLLLLNTVPCAIDLEKLLTWPKALTKFHMETWQEHGSSSYSTPISQPPLALSPITIMKALEPQQDSLEELFISVTYDDQGVDGSIIESLQSFTRLKRLGIRQDFIMHLDVDPEISVLDQQRIIPFTNSMVCHS